MQVCFESTEMVAGNFNDIDVSPQTVLKSFLVLDNSI